jgi:AcrR family transcriptional regulator
MSMKPHIRKPKARYHHGTLRDAALEAGVRELDAHGHVGFSLERVGKRLGVSPSALYRHYTSREELLRAVLWRGFERFVAFVDADAVAARDAALDTGPPGERKLIEAIGGAYLRFAVENPGWFRAQFSRDGAALSQGQEQAHPQYADILRAEVARTFSVDLGGPPDERVTRWFFALWAALHGAASMAVEHTIPPRRTDAERIAFAKGQLATVVEGMRAAAERDAGDRARHSRSSSRSSRSSKRRG